jgi:hypothetical protein
MKKSIIFLITISFIFDSKAQTNSTYSICNTALDRISKKDYQGFRNMFHVAVLNNASDEVIQRLTDQCASLINKYGLPTKESITFTRQTINSSSGPLEIMFLVFPFPAPKEKYIMPDRVISFGFIEKFGLDSLASCNIKDYAASDSLMTSQMTKLPFLKILKFNAKDISWFRIYYSKGTTDRKIGNDDGVFAVSGDKAKLDSLKIDRDFEKIFSLLEKAQIEKTNYRYGGAPKSNGRPEYIYFRIVFSTPPVDKFDELTIYVVINEEKGVKEDDYIAISHNDMNRYFVSKSKNLELFEILRDLAYKDYGNDLEKSP